MGRTLSFVGLVICLGACEDDGRSELALFLKRIDDYGRAPDGDKAEALAALRRLRPRSSAVREAHGVCMAAYGGIERAESEHARARDLLRDVEAGKRAFEATRPEILKAIRMSDEAVTGARRQIDTCTRLVARLRFEHD